jgi:hypothetical protein
MCTGKPWKSSNFEEFLAKKNAKDGSGAWTRTKITSSKGWRATNCTTPESIES